MFVFLHFTAAGRQGGVERYGRILEKEAITVNEGCSFTVDLDASLSDQLDLIRECIPSDSSIVVQFSHHFYEDKVFRFLEALNASGKLGPRHLMVIHDANNLPLKPASFFDAGLYWRPRTFIKSLRPDHRTKVRDQRFRRLYRLGYRFCVFSGGQANRLPWAARRGVIVAPHFVEKPSHSFDSGESREILGLTENIVLTILGYLNPRKQGELALAALKHLPDEYRLILAGGPLPTNPRYKDMLTEKIASQGLSGRVTITGYLSDEEQSRIISATDIGLCLFRKVSASGTLSTWIAHGIPILASNVKEIRAYNRMVDDAILLCDATTPRELAADILRLDPSQLVLQREALARIRTMLSTEQVWAHMHRSLGYHS